MSNNNRRDPIWALENQEDRQRREVVKATKHAVSNLSGDSLQDFLRHQARLLREFMPNELESISDDQEVQRG